MRASHDFEIETFSVGRRKFRAYGDYDQGRRAPWEEDHFYRGPTVTDWGPEPDEMPPTARVLCRDRRSVRLFYGCQFIENALNDGCDKKQAAEQLEACFQRCKDWCDDKWHYIGVTVYMLDARGNDIDPPPEAMNSLGGIESDDDDCIKEVSRELAEEIVCALKRKRKVA